MTDQLKQAMQAVDADDRITYTQPTGQMEKAVASALSQPLFDDHSKGLIAGLQGEMEKLTRARATLNERATIAEEEFSDRIAHVEQERAQARARFEAELDDLTRSETAVRAAVQSLQS